MRTLDTKTTQHENDALSTNADISDVATFTETTRTTTTAKSRNARLAQQTPMPITMAAAFAGMASVTEAMSQSRAAREAAVGVQLIAHSEIKPEAIDFLQRRWPQAETLKECESADWGRFTPDFVEVSFECSPYSEAGRMRMEKDPKARQVLDSVVVMEQCRPWLSLWENVPNFFRKDTDHGLFTQAQQRLTQSMICSDVVYMKDNRMGGCFRRERGFAAWQQVILVNSLPPWHPSPPAERTTLDSKPVDALIPTHELPQDVFREGTFRANPDRERASTADVHIAGWLWWGDYTYPQQPGIVFELADGWWKIGRCDGDCLQVFREPSRREGPKWIRANRVTRDMHTGKWYPVQSLEHAIKSPRQWGIEPEGRLGLTLDSRFSPPRVRTLTGEELMRLSTFAFDSDTKDNINSILRDTAMSDDSQARLASSMITAHMTTWWAETITTRLLQWRHFQRSIVHHSVPQQHIDAQGWTENARRIALLVVTMQEGGLVWLPSDRSVFSTTFVDESRAHKTAEALTTQWARSRSIRKEPFMVGEVNSHLPSGAKLIIMAVLLSHSDDISTSSSAELPPRWTPTSALTGLLQEVSKAALDTAAMLKGKSVLVRPSSTVRTGGVQLTPLAAASSLPVVLHTDFSKSMRLSILSDTLLRKSLRRPATTRRLEQMLEALQNTWDAPAPVVLQLPDVPSMLNPGPIYRPCSTANPPLVSKGH